MRLVYKTAIIGSLFIASCGGGSDDAPAPQPVVEDPKATTLIFPGNNTECNEGVVIDELKSRVTFQWNASEDTDSYILNIRNISTNQSSMSPVNAQEAEITIDRGTPYEWFVTSKATGTNVTADSPKFKFYNQGPGIENYAPFPAEAVNPTRGADVTNSGGNVTLEWKASDIDDDIEEYEVFFGTNESPTESLGTTTEVTINATVAAGTIYYWLVVTVDSQGNTSQSEVFEFTVSS